MVRPDHKYQVVSQSEVESQSTESDTVKSLQIETVDNKVDTNNKNSESNSDSMSNLSLSVVVGIVGNILSVVGVVICNKYIIEVDHFNFSVFLSFLHFSFTAIGMRVLLSMNYFNYASAPLSGVLPVALGSLLSVAFMNLNLAYNSVGFYQVRVLN